MTAPDGGFYSATDADSERPTEVEEGQVLRLVGGGDPARAGAGPGRRGSCVTTASRPDGNFEGAQHPARRRSPTRRERAALAGARAALYAARARRPPPLRDEKILAAWNGLAISALADGRPRSRRAALRRRRGARRGFVLDQACAPAAGSRAAGKDGRAGQPGFLEDYAFVARRPLRSLRGVVRFALAARGAGAAPARPRGSLPIQRGGWFMTAADHERLMARESRAYDGATPSGTSVALMNALRAAHLHGRRPLAGHRRPRALHPPRRPVGATDLAGGHAAGARLLAPTPRARWSSSGPRRAG